MTGFLVLLIVACVHQDGGYAELSKRPHLAIEWRLSGKYEGDSKELAEARTQFRDAMAAREWRTAYLGAVRVIELLPDLSDDDRAFLELGRAEIFLLAGASDEALKVARRHQKPLVSKDGKKFETVAEYMAHWNRLDHGRETEAEKDLLVRFSMWRQIRTKALELEVEAYRMNGDLAGALRAREAVEADHNAQTPFEPPRGYYWADRASQIEPLRTAKKGLDGLKILAYGGYVAQELEGYDTASQKRLVAVFANMTLGHYLRSKGDSAGAKKRFLEAKSLMEQKEVIVNREQLQWLIVREELDRLKG